MWLRSVRALFFGTILAVLTACGGGGGGGAPAPTYSIGGTLSGLAGGGSVVLQNNGGDDLTLTANGTFTFATLLPAGATYSVTIKTQKSGQVICKINSGTGNVSANVTDIGVICENAVVASVLAGGAGSAGNVDGTGSDARFYLPGSIAIDSGGNVYVADTSNNTIRKITPAGVVSTLAGAVGQYGDSDGAGSAARFGSTDGIAVDSGGNVYVADTSNHTIRKITPMGVVSTLAGEAGRFGSTDGAGSVARFYNPSGVAVDSGGNVYVADTSNNTIRKITPTGIVSTLAGAASQYGSVDGAGSAARFSRLTSIAVDGGGNAYVTDSTTIRKITSAGVVSTLAGVAGQWGGDDGVVSVARFASPQGIAVDSGGNVYVAEVNFHTIRKITPTGSVSTLAGNLGLFGGADGVGAAARFYYPSGTAVDSGGNVYVADKWNNAIRKVTPAGVVSTLAGESGQPGGADGVGSAARFYYPGGVAVDSGSNVYVADNWNHTIRKITPAGVVSTLAGEARQPGSADGAGSAARFNSPNGIAVDFGGNVYVADSNNHTIRKITPAGVVSTLAGVARQVGREDGVGSAAWFNYPLGIAVDSGGNVYVADSVNYTIRKITPAGVVSTMAGEAAQRGSVDGAGRVARFNSPHGIAVDSGGNVYVADTWNYTIRKITPAGMVSTLAGAAGQSGNADGVGSAARFDGPTGVAVDNYGNLYVTNGIDKSIRVISPAGVTRTMAYSTPGIGISSGFPYVAWNNGKLFATCAHAVLVADLGYPAN